MTRSTIGLVSHPRARRVERPEVDGNVALRSQHALSFDRFRTTHISQPQLAGAYRLRGGAVAGGKGTREVDLAELLHRVLVVAARVIPDVREPLACHTPGPKS